MRGNSVQRTFLGFVRCTDGFSIRLDGPQHNGLLSDLSVVLMGSFGLNLAGPLWRGFTAILN